MGSPSASIEAAPSAGRAPIWWGLLGLLLLVPIPFGSNRPWAWSVMSLLVAFLLGGWALAVMAGRRKLIWRRSLIVPVAIAFAVMLWVVVSIVPDFVGGSPVWDYASEQFGRALPRRISISVDDSLTALMRLGAYCGVFWLSLQYCRNVRRAEQLLILMSWSGLLFALYGLTNLFMGNTHILWFERWTAPYDVTATFVNRNHYATFAGLQLICALAIGISSFRSAWRLSDVTQGRAGRIAETLSGRPLIYFLIALVIATAWLQSHSRMGTVAVGIGIIVLLGLAAATGLIRRSWWLLALVAIIAAFLYIVSGQIVAQRMAADDSDRFALYSVVADQIMAAPYTGTGYGTFADAFLIYRDVRLPFATAYTAAHNSYLEFAAEIGLPAAVLALVGLLWCAAVCAIGAFRRRRNIIFPIVALSGSAIVAAHALFDFSIQIPAVAVTYAALLGMGVAQSWQSGGAGDAGRSGAPEQS